MATKPAPRAILKAAEICAQDPQRAGRYLVANSTSSMRRRTVFGMSRVFSASLASALGVAVVQQWEDQACRGFYGIDTSDEDKRMTARSIYL
jgi:hypothetical protein